MTSAPWYCDIEFEPIYQMPHQQSRGRCGRELRCEQPTQPTAFLQLQYDVCRTILHSRQGVSYTSMPHPACSWIYCNGVVQCITIDHLPTMTPLESSQQFCNDLLPTLMQLKEASGRTLYSDDQPTILVALG